MPEEKTLDWTNWDIDVDVKVKVRRAFIKEGQKAVEQNDDTLLYPYFAQFIKQWPYALDPSNPENYDELKSSEMIQVVKHVEAAFQRLNA